MQTYPKIQSIFKRGDRGRFTEEYARPEFRYLADNMWLFTEKIDGTNVRIGWDGHQLVFNGRTDRAQWPGTLFNQLREMFPSSSLDSAFPFAADETVQIILFGEGYGARIQKGGGDYLPDRVSFILFDVLVGRWWLKRKDVADIADKLNIAHVPSVGTGTLTDAVKFVQRRPWSLVGDRVMEGIVLRPKVELFGRDGERIITKVKVKDFS